LLARIEQRMRRRDDRQLRLGRDLQHVGGGLIAAAASSAWPRSSRAASCSSRLGADRAVGMRDRVQQLERNFLIRWREASKQRDRARASGAST
jgi:hypothetical protein